MNSLVKNISFNNSILKLMVFEMNNRIEDYKFEKGNLNIAVVGHVEWINFLKVDQLPKPGVISHSEKSLSIQLVVDLLSQCFAMGYFFGPFISGRILDLFGYASVIWLSISFACFMIFAILFKRLI